MLAERIKQALDILGSDDTVKGSLRTQATAYLGEEVDDTSLQYLSITAVASFKQTMERGMELGYSEDDCLIAAATVVLVAGMAVGKRLGIEDGERFARTTPDLGNAEEPEQ